MRKTGLVFHKDYLLHNAGIAHPERPERLKSIMGYLSDIQLLEQLERIDPYPAEVEWIATIHTLDYIEYVKHACENGVHYLDFDTGICADSYRIALLAAGGAMAAADAVMNKKIDNVFCAVRPPGHHAEQNRARGFCLFNNIAILARYLQRQHQLEKILIVDWDVHHGNGTQNAFYDDSTVFYFSIHQWPHYPGTGLQREKGIDRGEGFTLNVPLTAGHGNDTYIDAFQHQLVPALQNFKPDFILISAGFDAHFSDPLAGMQLTDSGYRQLTEIVAEIADQFCQGRIISLLEGGYDLEVLARSVAIHIEVLLKGEKS
jgi:Deacetylases, including yeast histone deacetylase and acetoin utilization protein